MEHGSTISLSLSLPRCTFDNESNTAAAPVEAGFTVVVMSISEEDKGAQAAIAALADPSAITGAGQLLLLDPGVGG